MAFGFLGMGPVTIAVDSFGPVTDNAQSVFELSRIEARPNAAAEIERDFGFRPDFAHAKLSLEKADGPSLLALSRASFPSPVIRAMNAVPAFRLMAILS